MKIYTANNFNIVRKYLVKLFTLEVEKKKIMGKHFSSRIDCLHSDYHLKSIPTRNDDNIFFFLVVRFLFPFECAIQRRSRKQQQQHKHQQQQ
jgi:hypothetical protein